MNKDEYKAAVSKIKASDKFKERVENSMKNSSSKVSIFKARRVVAAFAALILVACIGIAISYQTYRNPKNMIIGSDSTSKQNDDDFQITGKSSGEAACYALVVYIDGYSYSPNSWLKYSRSGLTKPEYEKLKGDKLGEVTIDLKGKTYKGTPSDFSSTYNVGTEIYAVKNMKKERAVLVVNNDTAEIFYRDRKAVYNEKMQINLTLSEIFAMIADNSKVTSVELRSEMDGSWMRTSEKQELLKFINKELPTLPILQISELGENGSGKQIPINLIFSDGSALNMQVLPEAKAAYIFGGFVKVSEELCKAVEELASQGSQSPAISDLIPYKVTDVTYLNIVNHTNGDKILCKTPAWSSESLFSILNYYRIAEAESSDAQKLVMTITIGKSKDDSIAIEFYEDSDKQIITKIKNKYYKPVKGKLGFEELDSFLYNYTEIGNAK